MLQVNDEGQIRTIRKVYVNDAGTLRQLSDVRVHDGGTLRHIFNADMFVGTSANPTSFVSTYGSVDDVSVTIHFNQPVGLAFDLSGTDTTSSAATDKKSITFTYNGVDGNDDTFNVTVNDYYTLTVTVGIAEDEEEEEEDGG